MNTTQVLTLFLMSIAAVKVATNIVALKSEIDLAREEDYRLFRAHMRSLGELSRKHDMAIKVKIDNRERKEDD